MNQFVSKNFGGTTMSNLVFTTKNPQTNQEITIRPERAEERTAVENLVRRPFGMFIVPAA